MHRLTFAQLQQASLQTKEIAATHAYLISIRDCVIARGKNRRGKNEKEQTDQFEVKNKCVEGKAEVPCKI
jgi:hypothetical protein